MKLSMKSASALGATQINLPGFLNNPFIYIWLGLALILTMTVMLFAGSPGGGKAARFLELGQRATSQLSDSVRAFQGLLEDGQVKALAELALEDPQKLTDLRQYLAGRLRSVEDVALFPANAWLKPESTFGEYSWVVIDMMLSAREHGSAPVQMVPVGGKELIAGMVSIGPAEARSGFMLVLTGKDEIMSGFQVAVPSGSYLGLEQYNGRFSPTQLAAFGDPASAVNGLNRIPVPKSLFRVVIPQAAHESSFNGFARLMVFLLGGLLLAFGLFKRHLSLHPVLELKEDPAQLHEDSITERSPGGSVPAEPDHPARTAKPAKPAEPKLPPVSLPDLSFIPDERKKRMPIADTPVELTREIFRAYDIRGVVGKTLDAGIARQVGQAIGTEALEVGATPVVVGRDGRHSGPDLVKGMIEGIASTGCPVIDIGAVPTGVLYFAAHTCGSGSGVMVTGSHNPPDYNGFKAILGGTTLSGERITALYDRLVRNEIRVGKGEVSSKEMLDAYRDRIASDIQLARPLKVVADCGNGIGGICAADVLRSIGAEVLPLFDEVDGSFPNHHPDPSDPHNLEDLIEAVRLMNADIGVAFDGDADRLGVVTPGGDIIYSDRIMMLFAREVLSRNPGARIIYDVKCTGKLDRIIREAGGEPEMYKTGHSLIKNHMKEVGSPFAGEMSGHFFFTDRWYGFDCGIYSAARLLEILANDDRAPQQVLNSLPNDISTPELKVEMSEGENHAFIAEFQEKAKFADARVSTIDGLRADFAYGWGLVRASNTTPILVVRFEAESRESIQIIQEAFRLQMLAVNPGLKLPF